MLHDVDELMPIGEFSERSGLSPKRLRSYSAGGLLVPEAVDSVTGYRYYSPGQTGLTQDGSLAVVNVGDSRAYLLHNGAFTQLTDDHSVTAEAVRRGEMSEQEAHDHPHRNVLTRALGVAPDVELDSAAHPALQGDRLLLRTDGLFNEIPNDEITSLMTTTGDLQATADRLVELALTRGGRDNISVVVSEISA